MDWSPHKSTYNLNRENPGDELHFFCSQCMFPYEYGFNGAGSSASTRFLFLLNVDTNCHPAISVILI